MYRLSKGDTMVYIKTKYAGYLSRFPSIDVTGSVIGMKKQGFWKKHDVVVRCGGFFYNIGSWQSLPPQIPPAPYR